MTETSWIAKKKTADKKFYGYTGPVKPDMKSYAVTKEGIKYITTKEGVVKQKKSKWISKKGEIKEDKSKPESVDLENQKKKWITKRKKDN